MEFACPLRELFPFVSLEKVFWFLLILLNNLRNLFIFCINVDIDVMLLLKKIKDLLVNAFRVFSLCYFVLVSASSIAK